MPLRSSLKPWTAKTWERFKVNTVLNPYCEDLAMTPGFKPYLAPNGSYLVIMFTLIALNYMFLTVLKMATNVATFPYYRIFQFNTLKPIKLIAKYSLRPEQQLKLIHHLDRWRNRKLAELQFISIACAILAAAVIGAFSWNAIKEAYWLASAFWYSSLVLSILGILLSAQQVTVLQLLGKPPTHIRHASDVRRFLPLIMTETQPPRFDSESHYGRNTIGEWRPRWKMVFTWQCPIMFMSYSVCFFLAGLTLSVCTPLIKGNTLNTDSNVAIIYLATGTIAGGAFVFCLFWIYHYIDLEHESEGMTARDADTSYLDTSPDAQDMPNVRRSRSISTQTP